MCTAEWLLPVCWGRLILDSTFINQVVSTVCFIHIVCRWDSLRLAPTGIDVRWEGVASGWGESPSQQDDLTSCLQLGEKKQKKPQLSFMKSIHSHMRVLRHVHTNTHTYNPTCLLMGCRGDSCANEAIFRWDHCRMPWLLFPFQNSKGCVFDTFYKTHPQLCNILREGTKTVETNVRQASSCLHIQ